MSNKMTGTYNEAVGSAKESLGRTVGNESLAAKGAAQNAEGHAQKTAATTQNKAKGVGNNIEGATQKAVGGATGNKSMEARGHANTALGDVQRNL
ncbi:hypothetical protein BGZ99_007161 [Dissophora globulifera]|uniref:CsbD-like domain-containing protein n=1 Tax=Dissophora globulifera TaxID=979702 RepID=A0A9P6RCF5_9FUNG|nr:hypothetical protein BGZ99_007161 [Dissophora globulifera]